MSRVPTIVWRLLGIGVMLTYLSSCLIGAQRLAPWLFAHVAAPSSELGRQVVTSFVAILLIGILPTILGILYGPRGKLWHSITSTLERIGQGDFGARVEKRFTLDQDGFGKLVSGINNMASELDRMERLRQEFISNVSHEIQSPLTSIGGFARALQADELDPDKRHQYTAIIEEEARRLSRLSDNLLKLTALESDQLLSQARRFRLDRQLQRVVLTLEPQWQKKHLDVEADLVPVEVVADEELMSQVWFNLVHNAVKFTPEGGRIGIRARCVDDGVLVEVLDSGPGIAANDQERIFERFFKADRSRNRGLGGSGLGLALVKRIVELHAGSVTVRSAPAEGATFRVALPTGMAARPQ